LQKELLQLELVYENLDL